MSKLCSKCGAKLPNKAEFCPNCGQKFAAPENAASKRASEKGKNPKSAKKQKSSRGVLWTVVIALIIIIDAIVISAALVAFNVCDVPIVSDIMEVLGWTNADTGENSDDEWYKDEYAESLLAELEEINIGESTRSRCEVLETIEISDAAGIVSESEVAELFNDRGFDGSSAVTMYSMDGDYLGDDEVIDATSETDHPLYYVLYASSDDYYWMIYYCNGEFIASPLSYVWSGLSSCEVLVSENEYVMSYDSETNCFYRLIPNEGYGTIITTSKIDAETLDEFAEGELALS
ncbi:MAG: zinc ribbon domain-containing protein [Clostridia bacterium]|nr:zinc ribbon domain-containing protein [Clostridia bacterium]